MEFLFLDFGFEKVFVKGDKIWNKWKTVLI